MRTTLDIDDALMEALLARLPGTSKREAVEQAIRGYLSTDVVARLRALRGVIEIDDLSGELRRDRPSSRSFPTRRFGSTTSETETRPSTLSTAYSTRARSSHAGRSSPSSLPVCDHHDTRSSGLR